jgi:hypothetical protein
MKTRETVRRKEEEKKKKINSVSDTVLTQYCVRPALLLAVNIMTFYVVTPY